MNSCVVPRFMRTSASICKQKYFITCQHYGHVREGICIPLVVRHELSKHITICDLLWEKVHFRAKTKIELLASNESAKLALSNDAIIALVAASIFAP